MSYLDKELTRGEENEIREVISRYKETQLAKLRYVLDGLNSDILDNNIFDELTDDAKAKLLLTYGHSDFVLIPKKIINKHI